MMHWHQRTFILVAAMIAVTPNSPAQGKLGLPGVSATLESKTTQDVLEAAAHEKTGRPLSAGVARQLSKSQRAGKTQFILVNPSQSPSPASAAKALGMEVVGTYDLPGNIRHTVVRSKTVSPIVELASRPDVTYVVPEPPRLTRSGSVVSQGDNSIRGSLARTNFAVNGSGIRVGVISDSISRTGAVGGTVSGGFLTGSNPQGSGNLPSTIRVINNGVPGDTDEGAAMLEIIHDIAPAAPLSFADAASYSGFAANITALRTDAGQECKIVVDDIGYLAEPTHQAGHIEVAANLCLPNNVLYFSAFGNDGEDAHERAFTDPTGASDTANPPSGVDLHDFGAAAGGASDKFLTFQIPASAGMDLVLRWDEPGNGSFAQGTGATGDLDLFLVDSTALPITVGAIRGSSRNVQGSPATPAGSPLEFISYVNSTGITQTVHVIVDHFSGRVPSRVHLSVFADSSIIFTDRASCQDFSSFGHPNGVNVVGVAASFYGEIDSGGLLDAPGGQIDVESFSSKGGAVPLLIGDNGVRLVSPETRSKPELTAPDGGNNSFFGSDIGFDLDAFPNFFGTSAAAPHAAAAAALVWSARPSLTANQVLNALRTTARDIETAGIDVLSGSGLIDTNAAIQSVLPAGVDDWSLFEN